MTQQQSLTRPSFLRSISASSSATFKPQKDKLRVYIALYPRGGSTTSFSNHTNCDSFHWCIVFGPQTASRADPGTRYHLAHSNHNTTSTPNLYYAEDDILSTPTAQTVLVRIAIAKVTNLALAESILRSIPIPTSEADPSYTCLAWTKRAYLALIDDDDTSFLSGLNNNNNLNNLFGSTSGSAVKSYLSAYHWPQIEECARDYVKRKREMRRFTDPEGPWDLGNISTFNFWENRETMP